VNIIYCIDTSSLIELKEKYPQTIFTNLWNNIDELIQKGRIIAPLEVKKEIEKGDDELKSWVKNKKRNKMFIKPDKFQVEKAKEILSKYSFLAKPDKVDDVNADPWLISLVVKKLDEEKDILFKNKYIIVTEESQIRINRIPSVCKQMNIECINLIKMFEKEGWKF
jgi:protein associated with RNAse G/E